MAGPVLMLFGVYDGEDGRGRLAADWFCGLSFCPWFAGLSLCGHLAVQVL